MYSRFVSIDRMKGVKLSWVESRLQTEIESGEDQEHKKTDQDLTLRMQADRYKQYFALSETAYV